MWLIVDGVLGGRLVEPAGELAVLALKKHTVPGKRVLTDDGDGLGEVKYVEFDPAGGAIRTLLTSGGEVAAWQLIALGSYALMVRTA